MNKLVPLALLVALLLLAACGSSVPAANTVKLGASSFSTVSLTIKAGDQVEFQDPTSGGGTHNLLFGNRGLYIPNKNGPTELNSSHGVNFSAGDTRDYTFAKAGVYEVTCTIHPSMNVIITVR